MTPYTWRNFVNGAPMARVGQMELSFLQKRHLIYKLSVIKPKTGQKTGKNPPKKGVFISTSDHLSNFWRQQLLRPATFRASNFSRQQLFSSFLQKSQSSCHCFDRHQLGFTNSILLNGIFDTCSRIYSLQIGHQCYLQSAPSVGINLNHDLEEGSYWSINFELTNKSCWREKLLASKVVGAKSC